MTRLACCKASQGQMRLIAKGSSGEAETRLGLDLRPLISQAVDCTKINIYFILNKIESLEILTIGANSNLN